MRTRYWGLAMLLLSVARLALAQSGQVEVTIGIVLPQGAMIEGGEAAESLRQSLIGQLKSQSIDAVPLTATSGAVLDGEAHAKHCSYVLYTRLEDKGGAGGARGMLGNLSSALSLGALIGRGGAGNTIANTALQGAAGAATASPQEQAESQLMGAAQAVKPGDTVTLDYRLIAVESKTPAEAKTLSAKAGAAGQDIVGPMIAQLTSSVAAAARGASVAAAAAATGDSHPSSEHSSSLGGLFGHKSSSSPAPAGAAGAGAIDCAKIASMPNSTMTFDACQELLSAQQTYTRAASDPSAVHAGDDAMSCAEIAAELKQQQYSAPDPTKVAAAQATAGQTQTLLKEEYQALLKQKAEDQATLSAAAAADTATEVTTGGLVRGRSLDAAQKVVDARDAAHNEKFVKASQPVAQQQNSQVADFATDAAGQLQSNPRLARLVQLANAKHCKGGG